MLRGPKGLPVAFPIAKCFGEDGTKIWLITFENKTAPILPDGQSNNCNQSLDLSTITSIPVIIK